jgi:hypothetical protein
VIFEPNTGRYTTVTVAGRSQRIYVATAGQGRPVLCLNTAGADTLQWRHILTDADLTSAHQFLPLICFGMANPCRHWGLKPKNTC